MKTSFRRSPLFYVGDKYKLMSQLVPHFPKVINHYYEPFVGGGTVFLNLDAKRYYLNDIDKHLINIHQYLIKSSHSPADFFARTASLIESYGLSRSYQTDLIPKALKQTFIKTYYARFNQEGYNELRKHVNLHAQNDPLVLYLLVIYGFNRMLRFNRAGQFNLPVGNVDFNKNVYNALTAYFDYVATKKITLSSHDFHDFFKGKHFAPHDFVYVDPPYLITASEYNKIWDNQTEASLLSLLDSLNQQGVKFALSNVTHYNGIKNDLLLSWMKKYHSHQITSNYINYHNNGQKNLREVLITNY